MERQGELGGTVNLAKKPPLKEHMQWIADYYTVELKKLGVEVRLNTEASKENIMAENPDAVIIATGSVSIIPESIKGINENNVYTVENILKDKTNLENKNVVVIGAGLTGLETSEYLCVNGNKVTIVDILKQPAPNANHTNVADVCSRLQKYGAQYKLCLLYTSRCV